MEVKSTMPESNFLKSSPYDDDNTNEELVKEKSYTKQDTNKGVNSNNNNNLLLAEGETIVTKNTCACSNISIMHLFHEMKQDFPTIPDVVVAQCVSENCHQRDNCIKILRNALELNPVPTQCYPSKIIHASNVNLANNNEPYVKQKPEVPPQPIIGINENTSKRVPLLSSPTSSWDSFKNNYKQPIVPNMKTMHSQSLKTQSIVANNVNQVVGERLDKSQSVPKARPTTLNLNSISQNMQQQQHSQNIQLQKEQHQKNILESLQKTSLSPLTSNHSSIRIQHSLQRKNLSLDPTSTSSEDEISINIALENSLPTSSAAMELSATHNLQTNQISQSFKRHCSVITVQPDLPYTRDLITTSSTARCPLLSNQLNNNELEIESVNTAPKSFTSVNLTLRQPIASGVHSPQQMPSTIDLRAGPTSIGSNSTGFSYHSSSYDARQGCQKNFHITVTDDGSLISASRINQLHKLQNDNNQGRSCKSNGNVKKNSDNLECDMYQTLQSDKNLNLTMVIKRQKEQRDKVAVALRENKKRLQRLNSEIRLINETFRCDVKQSVVIEIEKLRKDCESMVDDIESLRKSNSRRIEQRQYNQLQYHGRESQQYQQHVSSLDESRFETGIVGGSENNVEIILDDNEERRFWECQLCTFHNYPDLNICECCNAVRILPGTLSHLNLNRIPNVDAGTATLFDNNHENINGHLEHDTNLSQHFALHT